MLHLTFQDLDLRPDMRRGRGAHLVGLRAPRANLRRVVAPCAEASAAHLLYADLSKSDFQGAVFTGANLRGVRLELGPSTQLISSLNGPARTRAVIRYGHVLDVPHTQQPLKVYTRST